MDSLKRTCEMRTCEMQMHSDFAVVERFRCNSILYVSIVIDTFG